MPIRNRLPPSSSARARTSRPKPSSASEDESAAALTATHRRKRSDDDSLVSYATRSCSEDDDRGCYSSRTSASPAVRSSVGGGGSARREAECPASGGGGARPWPWLTASSTATTATATAPALAFLFVLCAAISFASTIYGAGPPDADAAAAGADAALQMMQLLHEVGLVDERARHYEEEERRLRGEVEQQREEIERLRSKERDEEEAARRVDLENRRLRRELAERERRRQEEEEEERRRRREEEEEQERKLRGKATGAANAVQQGGVFMKQIEKMREDLQEHNRREILDKYGEGPYLVRVQLDFPVSAPGGPGPGAFTIRMAPIKHVPHSVLQFLDQVRHRLWDGCSFRKNMLHAVGAEPVPPDPRAGGDPEPGRLEEAFRSRGLHSIAFREFSEEFPHRKYTVGFDGHPGGPGWFVNVRDNFKVFGKGPPPAFGEVMSGVETVERLKSMPVERRGIHKVMVDPVAIVSMRIVETSHG